MAENLERNLFAVCRDLTKHGKPLSIIYDIGANDGRWTAKIGSKLPARHFYQWEANPNCLCKMKNMSRVTRFTQVLSDKDDEEVKFYIGDSPDVENTGFSYYQENTKHYTRGKFITLPTKTLDTFVKKENKAGFKLDKYLDERWDYSSYKPSPEKAWMLHIRHKPKSRDENYLDLVDAGII